MPRLDITSELKGICNINFNVGKANITLLGSKEDYTIIIEKGTGNATIDNTPVRDSKTYGSGVNNIKIDNGMGNLAVNFKEK